MSPEGLQRPMRTPPAVGHPSSIAEAYESEFDNIWRTLRRLGLPETILEDAVQEVFLAAHARLHTFDHARPMRPWLYGIAIRVASEMRRRQRRTTPNLETAEAIVARDRSGPEEALAAREARTLMDQALAQLDFDQRVVLVMHDLDELPAPTIAETISAPLNTVYSRLRLARAKVAAFVARKRGQR
jgi:RNA polymerase sigma-70 factor, ECF subfamily